MLARGAEQEIALVAARIGAFQHDGTVGAVLALDVMAGGQGIGAEIAGDGKQIAELDGLIAQHARDRGFAANIGFGELIDHVGMEGAFHVHDVMGDAQHVGDGAGVVDILAGTAGVGPTHRLAVIVKL